MLQWTKLKHPDSWQLLSLTSASEITKELSSLTIVSELDFKRRLVYQELECLFRRKFETELLDNLDVLRQIFKSSTNDQV